MRDYYSRYSDTEVGSLPKTSINIILKNKFYIRYEIISSKIYIFQHLVRNEEGHGDGTAESRPATHWEAWKKFGRNMCILMPCKYLSVTINLPQLNLIQIDEHFQYSPNL